MRRSLALALLLTLLCGGVLSAQALDDVLVPRGRVRLQMFPVYSSWSSRFGRTADGTTGKEDLGEDLTSSSASSLFPGTASLVSAIESMGGISGYAPVLGESMGRVTKNVTRVEFGGHIGIFDWLTIGAKLPWVRTRTSVDLLFSPDTINGDLGLNPVSGSGGAVSSFLQSLGNAQSAAAANATSICSSSPGSAACSSAQDLATRAASFSASASTAYGASPFFPMSGSAAAGALGSAASSLNADLVAAGLPGIGSMVFATEWIAEDKLGTLAGVSGLGVEGEPLGDVISLWNAGDVEVTASVRLLEGARQDSTETSPHFSYRLIGTFLTRLPTGAIDNTDVFLDVGTGDGQTDFEGRLLGEVTLGHRLGIRAAGRYGIQLPRTLERRVAPPEQVLAPLSSRQLVEWDPGSYFGVEVSPVFRIAPELSVGAEYRVYRKYRDAYTLAGSSVGAPVDPVVMQVESGITVHHLGGVLRYDTVARRMESGTGWPLQLHMRVLHAFEGGGGQTPVTTQLEFGVSVFRRFWGAP
jgi:hypothetical protein